jgi:plastocyanin
MRRAVVGLAVAASLAGAGLAHGSDARDAQAGTAVGVAQDEFTLNPYRRVVKRGPVRFNIQNYGEDAHNLVIRGPKRFKVESPEIEPGGRLTLPVTLRRPGTYRLLCTKADHLSRGMRSRLRVRR